MVFHTGKHHTMRSKKLGSGERNQSAHEAGFISGGVGGAPMIGQRIGSVGRGEQIEYLAWVCSSFCNL